MSGKYDDLIRSVCETLNWSECPPEIPANLILGDQILSTGRAKIGEDGLGSFVPDSEIKQDILNLGITLKLMGNDHARPIKNLCRCSAQMSREHYHFELA